MKNYLSKTPAVKSILILLGILKEDTPPLNAEDMPYLDAREKLDEYAEMQGWNKNKLIGWSEAADFAEWFKRL